MPVLIGGEMTVKTTDAGLADDARAGLDVKRNIVLQIKCGNHATGFELPPNVAIGIVTQLFGTLARHADPEVRGLCQALGIADISAQLPHPNVPTLKYTTEVGLQMETSIEVEHLRTLYSQIGSILQALDSAPKPAAH